MGDAAAGRGGAAVARETAVRRACGPVGAVCLLALVLLRVFDFSAGVGEGAAAGVGAGVPDTFGAGLRAGSDAVCAGMLAVAVALLLAQAASEDRLRLGEWAAYAAATCCAVGSLAPAFSSSLSICGALLGGGAALLAFFWLQGGCGGDGAPDGRDAGGRPDGCGRSRPATLARTLLPLSAVTLAAAVVDCVLLSVGDGAARVLMATLGVAGAACAVARVRGAAGAGEGGARGGRGAGGTGDAGVRDGRGAGEAAGPGAPEATGPAGPTCPAPDMGCRVPPDGHARPRPESTDGLLPRRGTWGTLATLAVPLACAWEAVVLLSSTGAPSFTLLGTPGAALDLAVCCALSVLAAALAPGGLTIVYWGVLPFLGAVSLTFELTDDGGALYLLHVGGITVFFGMALLYGAAVLACLARRGELPAAFCAGVLCATLSAASLVWRGLGFPKTIDPSFELVPNALIVAWIACTLVYWAGVLRLRTTAPDGGAPAAATVDEALLASRRLCERCGLSSREAQIVAYVAQGYNAPYIAERLAISDSTVRSHLRVVYQKAGVGSRMELVELLREGPGQGSGRQG